jgi:lipoprotein-releasing system ATP-binding protein
VTPSPSVTQPLPAVPILSLQGIRKSYGRGGPELLKAVDLAVALGQSLAIMGPSGSGKSTLLHIMGGLVRPDAGRVAIEGTERSRPAEWDAVRARVIGHVFQESWLLPALTAAENVEIPMIGVERSKDARRRRVAKLLEIFSIADRSGIRAAQLSGGERQRVAFARALANRPRIVLADEPTGNLDARNTAMMVDLVRDLCREEATAVVVATHDPKVAGSCDVQFRLETGMLVPATDR